MNCRGVVRGMDSDKAQKLEAIRADNKLESEARIQAAKSFSRGMSVKTQDGKVGRVSSVNYRTGSIEVVGRGFLRPEWHSASTLEKP
ncbi:MAG: hypothetical protein Q8S35_03385 [bacterium]|nr:hypothetical protein [bacterium]